ncbi:MAG: NUDIX hydrolase [Candidatus Baltobacteraceae bacterium]
MSERIHRVHLATGLLRRGDSVLLVASQYASPREPLWGLPGGHQQGRESLARCAERECCEETGLAVRCGELLYISESYDGSTQYLNSTFAIEGEGVPRLPEHDDRVVAVEFVPIADIAARMTVAVVREPLLATLRNPGARRYFFFPSADVSVRYGRSRQSCASKT